MVAALLRGPFEPTSLGCGGPYLKAKNAGTSISSESKRVRNNAREVKYK
jgi:hypothetical protein